MSQDDPAVSFQSAFGIAHIKVRHLFPASTFVHQACGSKNMRKEWQTQRMPVEV